MVGWAEWKKKRFLLLCAIITHDTEHLTPMLQSYVTEIIANEKKKFARKKKKKGIHGNGGNLG